MRNSLFVFAAALFMLTSCTLSQEDTPQPTNDLRDSYENFQVSKDAANASQLEKEEEGNQFTKRGSKTVNISDLELKKQSNVGPRKSNSFNFSDVQLKNQCSSCPQPEGGKRISQDQLSKAKNDQQDDSKIKTN